jgi:cell division protein FtsL
MSVAYNTNTAFDYRRYDEQEEYEEQAAPVKRPVDRSIIMARRVIVMAVSILAAAVCIGLIYMKAQVFMAQRDINNTQTKIAEAQKTNSILNEQYNEAINTNTIMKKAGELGMGYPAADQILLVTMSSGTKSIEMKSKK